ncbi:MAG: hypothetical protein QNL88_12475, partial [Acidobacteriota bacterium]|nr:hypothetical protein [Acidobacteriota bacterium]
MQGRAVTSLGVRVNPAFGEGFPGGATFNIVGSHYSPNVNSRASNTIEKGTSGGLEPFPHDLPSLEGCWECPQASP